METILSTVKKVIGGIHEDDEYFDEELIEHINAVLSVVTAQLGIGPAEGYNITSKYDKWSDILPDFKRLAFVKEYVGIQCKLYFDHTLSAHTETSLKEKCKELEWRMVADESLR